jgi:hypothetical protein
MRNAAILLIVGAVGLFVYHQETSLQEQRHLVQELTAKVQELTTKPATVPKKTTNLDLQQRCAAQANKMFALYGWEKEPTAGFTNHFNSEMGKCFMLIVNTSPDKQRPGTSIETRNLSDAFERKEYAEYFWHSDEKKKYWEVRPFMCKVTLPSGEDKFCQSSDEFEELIKVYME